MGQMVANGELKKRDALKRKGEKRAITFWKFEILVNPKDKFITFIPIIGVLYWDIQRKEGCTQREGFKKTMDIFGNLRFWSPQKTSP